MNPQLAEAHNNLGTALAASGRLEEAVAALRQATDIQPLFAEAYLNLGVVLRRLGRFPESAEALDRAVTLRPDLDVARYQRAVTALERGDAQAARRDLDVLRGRDPNLAARLAAALQRSTETLSGTAPPPPVPPGRP